MQRDLTQGNITRILLRFSGPYLVASFLQTFYGLADMFITGQYNGAGTISAVAVGSQVMHMLTSWALPWAPRYRSAMRWGQRMVRERRGASGIP